MGWEVLSEGTPPLTPASVSKIVSDINDVVMNRFNYLSEEIITKILTKLPIKSLIRCTSVCKFWRAIIKHPRFTFTHNNASTHLILLHSLYFGGTIAISERLDVKDFKKETYTLQSDDNKGFDQYCKVELPVRLRKMLLMNYYLVVGTCNGIVCLADDLGMYDGNFALWNPSVRRYMILPKPSIKASTHNVLESTIGMGYDVRSNDYKIVRVVTLLEQAGFPTSAQVYSLSKGTWGEVRTDLPQCSVARRALPPGGGPGEMEHVVFGMIGYIGQAFVNGVVHLVVLRRIGDTNNYFVLTFDVGSEAFGEIKFPKKYKPRESLELRLSATGDGKSIALFVMNNTGLFLDIWVIKEYRVKKSWTKLMILNPQGPEKSLHQAVCVRKSGEVLLVREGSGELIALDTVNKQLKHLGVYGGHSCTAYSYEESLVLLDRKDAVSY